MELVALEVRRVVLPLATPFVTAAGTERERDVVVVRAIGAGGEEGWAECVAPTLPTYTGEWAAGAEAVLVEVLAPLALAGGDLTAVKGNPMARSALDLAVLDAELRATGTSLATHLGATRDRVPAGVAVGIAGSVAALVDEVAGHVDAGYRRVKLKIRPGWDIDPVAAVRERFPDLDLQVDANGAYASQADPASALAVLDTFGLLLVEQPLADDDLVGHAALAARITTPVCLDESITSVASTETALALGACSVVNLKLGRVGGIDEAVRIHDLCLERGVGLWCGGMLETGLGRAANVALAALPGFTLTGDLSASDRWYSTDLTEPFVLDDGHLVVPTAPGLGVTPDPVVLLHHTVSHRMVRP